MQSLLVQRTTWTAWTLVDQQTISDLPILVNDHYLEATQPPYWIVASGHHRLQHCLHNRIREG